MVWKWITSVFEPRALSDAQYEAEKQRLIQLVPKPVVWLFGKTGSGKTSIIRYLTGAQDAEIGNGFRPQTRFSRQYDFPSSDQPVMRFLDTRGLGEIHYEPDEDLVAFAQEAHLLIVTARVMDHAQVDVIEPLKRIRKASPNRPVLLVLTCLHEAYPGEQHPTPDPYPPEGDPAVGEIPSDLARSLQTQRSRFSGLVDAVVVIDLTRPEEGFAEPSFGGERLRDAIAALLPAVQRQTLLSLNDALAPLHSLQDRRAMPVIWGYSSLAATAGAVPVPWVDIPVVLAIQSHLIYKLAALYHQELEAKTLSSLAAAVGGRIVARVALQELLKFIPYVGSAANAALAFAWTFSLGKACCWYFSQLGAGFQPDASDLERVWREQLQSATELWARHKQ